MKPTKQRRAELAAIRQDVLQNLKKIYSMAEIADLLKEILHHPDRALDRFYQYRDRRDCQIRLLQERVKNLMKQNLMSRSFGQMILYELKQIH